MAAAPPLLSTAGRRSWGRPHMSFRRMPLMMSLFCSLSAALSASTRSLKVTNAQWRFSTILILAMSPCATNASCRSSSVTLGCTLPAGEAHSLDATVRSKCDWILNA